MTTNEILVVGGGFAGVWSAAAAVRAAGEAGAEIGVTLVSAGDDLVIRPRLYQSDPDRMRVPLDAILGPVGVRRVAATVRTIDVAGRAVTAVGRDGRELSLAYDQLVLTAGSQVVRPRLEGAAHLYDVDTIEAATALDQHLRDLPPHTVVVVGAGFTGLEVATELAGRAERVVLVDRSATVGAALGEGPRAEIEGALDRLGVERRLGTTVTSLTPSEVRLSSGEVIASPTVVWTVGMVASPLTAQIPAARDGLGRLLVDEAMRVPGVPGVYAAGDTAAAVAEAGQLTMQSCQYAQPMGKCAGHNAVTDRLGLAPRLFTPDPYSNHLDLGPAGAVATKGFDRVVSHTGERAKAEKQIINTRFIYPPAWSAEALLARAGQLSNRAAAGAA
ncbi:NAD(P)/FAD-dependent oxidoreductase [Actinoplanes sp. CA-054009]